MANFLKIPDDCNLRLSYDIIRAKANLIEYINKMLQNYQKGMSVFDDCHNSTVRSQWVALTDEIGEFVSEPSLSEIWDILHAAGRLFYKLTGVPLNLLAYPTVRKHSQRFEEYGCIRSQRNCEGKCCKQLTVDS
ncbi:MAG: hypothetical protein QQW96_13765 [Tychonema bourrellyi B0820]|uniref:hypothetical protein n=1 Tax=Tychonema bourrellyi TaxID=54313 RepID=UPI001FE6AB54|nr:hypothetical protein [Tychonema bourrellyi]MDQ2098702.1 hypothetical protein [Tychonema bourrellyi B0820]